MPHNAVVQIREAGKVLRVPKSQGREQVSEKEDINAIGRYSEWQRRSTNQVASWV